MELKRHCNNFFNVHCETEFKLFPNAGIPFSFDSKVWRVTSGSLGGNESQAYAWSLKGVANMVSSWCKTMIHKDAYVSQFEDEFGNV